MSADDRVAQNGATSTVIAQHPHPTATPSLRVWKEVSMRRFAGYLPGNAAVAPGCDDRRDSHDLARLGLSVTSLDLSDGMLAIARRQDPGGDHRCPNLRHLARRDGTYDAIWAGGCLSAPDQAGICPARHRLPCAAGNALPDDERGRRRTFRGPAGHALSRPRRGADAASRQAALSHYGRDELITLLQGFELLHEQRVEPSEGGFELWL